MTQLYFAFYIQLFFLFSSIIKREKNLLFWSRGKLLANIPFIFLHFLLWYFFGILNVNSTLYLQCLKVINIVSFEFSRLNGTIYNISRNLSHWAFMSYRYVYLGRTFARFRSVTAFFGSGVRTVRYLLSSILDFFLHFKRRIS